MQLIVRFTRTVVLVLALLAIASTSAAAASTSTSATPKVSVEAAQSGAKDCWQAECGSGPVPWKLVLPICYAHEGSQYVPQCQDIYP